MKNKTVVLIGSGHAHLEVIKALSIEEIAEHRFLLISPSRNTYYSGLIPRLIMGEIEEKHLTINSADYAESKGFSFIEDQVQSIDQINRSVSLKSGEKVQFDILSLNVGGTPIEIPSESPFNTVHLRPFSDFLPKWREIQRICSACMQPQFVVVGGGAAAVEVAVALKVRLNKNQAKDSEVHLVTKGSRLCENYSENISDKIKQSLLNVGIKIYFNEPVNQIFKKNLRLRNGSCLKFDAIFIATPTNSSDLVSGKIDSKLRLSSNIFAVGDGAEMVDYPNLPRSGVIAVRQGRHLIKNIRSLLNNNELLDFLLPKRQLNILITGANSALLIWGSFYFEGLWPLRIKNWIDKKYMTSFKIS